MELAEGLGYLALVLVVASSSMRTLAPLRVLSIASNVTFIGYSLAEGLLPILILHSLLLPINSIRLFQMQRLVSSVKEAAHGDLALEGLLPFMTRRKVARGEVLFRKGELADEMFYVLTGEIRLPEVGRNVGAGIVLGEISMFSPERRRTASAICTTDCELLAMSENEVRRLYFENPKFGFYLVQLITRRLLENCAAIEPLPARLPKAAQLRARAAA